MNLAAAALRSGDVLLVEGRSLFALGIKLRTRSRFSHAGIVLRIAVGGAERLCILESLEPWGVRLYPLDRYLERCSRKGECVHWYALEEGVDRQQVAAYALAQWGKRYASVWQFLVSWGRITGFARRLLGLKPADTNAERFFCSELVASALRAGGYRPDDDLPEAATDPGAIALYGCLRRRGMVTP